MSEGKLVHIYALDDSDVREAIILWLKSKHLPAPMYVGDTADCTWFAKDGKTCVEWTQPIEIVS